MPLHKADYYQIEYGLFKRFTVFIKKREGDNKAW